MSKPELRQLPALEIDGVAYARFGTRVSGAIALASWLFHAQLSETVFAELPQISTAAFILGLIGTQHVTRRARRLTQRG